MNIEYRTAQKRFVTNEFLKNKKDNILQKLEYSFGFMLRKYTIFILDVTEQHCQLSYMI